jgi:hypothetical protein
MPLGVFLGGLPMSDEVVAYIVFADGRRRPVYQDATGRQYVVHDDGEPVHGIWYIPRDECDAPIVVDTSSSGR